MRFGNLTLTLLMSLAGFGMFSLPRGVQAQPPYAFEDIGAGVCVDANSNRYDGIEIRGGLSTSYPTITTPAECETHCAGCANEVASDGRGDLRGFDFYDSYNTYCICLFDDVPNYWEAGSWSGTECASYGVYSSGRPSTSSGVGPVAASDASGDNSNAHCYKATVVLAPSSQPSVSLQPSESPSDVPSVSSAPSESPSSQPSESRPPSESPSVTPSQTPSDVPSTEPSSEPSSTPSCSPSASPTTNPSNEYGVNLWYPKWMHGDEGCRNDGEEPNYMASNPNYWLSSTLENCCKQWFGGYAYNNCMGNYPPGDCTVKLYYPDWQGSNTGCLNDGQEPYYMLGNADHFLSNTLQECCDKFYLWNLYTCTGTTPTLTNGDYYPDWLSASAMTCKNDGQFPEYMLADQGHYLSTTLEKCCDKFYHWDVNACLGTSAVGSTDWYVQWTSYSCKQDCEVGSATACGGLAEFWDETFSTLDQCCKAKLPWVSLRTCREDSQS